MIRIACLITCHNRRDTTLACLRSLFGQELGENLAIETYLVDDGCTDGTARAVAEQYPQVKILRGDGSLYWCGGTRLAFEEAIKGNYDYYLWLNDDVILFSNAIRTMYDTVCVLAGEHGGVIVAGSLKDSGTGEHSYGGVRRKSIWPPLRFVRVKPGDLPLPCDTFSGNVVLIPLKVAESVGNLSPDYTHGLGDYDYGFRAVAKGFSCWIGPGFVGTCSHNPLRGTARDGSLPVSERLNKMSTPVEFVPIGERMLYIKRHAGLLWPIECLLVLGRICFPSLWLLMNGKKPRD